MTPQRDTSHVWCHAPTLITPAERVLLEHDQAVFGESYIDCEGRRVDPRAVRDRRVLDPVMRLEPPPPEIII